MHRSSDDCNPDDMDGGDYSNEVTKLESRLFPDESDIQPRYAVSGYPSRLIETSGNYTEDWPKVSAARKSAAGYRCADCKVVVSARPNLLHTHHVDGDKSNNQLGNLRVLCADCHNRRHGPAYVLLPKDREYLSELRKQQGLANPGT